MINQTLTISSVEHLNAAYFIITVDLGSLAKTVKAGQFFQIKSHDITFPMLRKPISVYNIEGNYCSFMIKILGKGTQTLSRLQSGNRLDILGPLGNGFPIKHNQKALLISGGVGYPPLWQLRKELLRVQTQYFWLHGGQGQHDIFPADEIWTVDGSFGQQGFVTAGLPSRLTTMNPDIIYACGPKPMLRACHDIIHPLGIPFYVSLEEYMACGLGVCHGCAVAVKAANPEGFSYQNVCTDGPVFNADDIIWD